MPWTLLILLNWVDTITIITYSHLFDWLKQELNISNNNSIFVSYNDKVKIRWEVQVSDRH